MTGPFDVPMPVIILAITTPIIILVAPVVTAEDETNNNQAMAVEVPAIIPPPRYQAQRHGEAALPPEPSRRNVNAERWRQPLAFNTHIANNNGNIRGNDRGRGNNVQQPEPIQDSDDEMEEIPIHPPVFAVAAPVS